MQIISKIKGGLVVVLLILAIPTFVYDQGNRVTEDNNQINPGFVIKSKVDRIQDLPITITNNIGFSAAGFSGSGSDTDPYLLKDITIVAGGVSGINITDTTAYFRIENVTINGSTDINARGIILTNVIHGTIDNNTIYNCDGGIALGSSENNVVVNNTIYNITKVGINIYTGASKDNIVSGNIIYNITGPSSKGIDLSYGAKNNTISSNEIFNCAYYAIVMGTQAYNNTISDNNIFNCTYNALYIVTNTHHNLFTNNKIHDCISHAIFSFLNANNNTYSNNSFYNLQNGIVMDNTSDNSLSGNAFHNITNIGIWLYSTSQNNTLASNRITDCNTGIHISTSSNSTVLDNTISNCATNGIYLSSASNDSVVNRNVLFNNSQYGIYLDTTSESNKVEWNSFLHNNGSGIQAYDDGINNIFDYNHWNDHVVPDTDTDGFVDSIYSIIGGNTDSYPRVAPIWINENSDFADLARSGDGTLNDPYLIEGYQFTSNKSVLINITNTTAHFHIEDVLINGVTNTGVAGISLKNVTNGQIKRTTVTNCYRGLVLEISNITIQDNSFSNIANTGIYVISGMFNSVIAGNSFNSSGTAIALVSSEDNIIANNSITNILNAGLSFGSGCGIYIPYSAYNEIVNNTIRDVNTHGILIGEISNGNDVINNTISNAGAHGVVVFHYTGATTITENIITGVGGRGITIESVCNDAIITNNTITNAGQQGIFLWNGDRATVSRNIVYNSTGYGIELHTESNDDEITWNSFIQNNESGTQAYDNGTNNLFSYNYWDDLTPTDIDNDGFVDNLYVITGPANNADPLPRAELIPRPQSIVINGPKNFSIPFGKTGYSLTWTVNVTYHDSYTVYRNETVIAIGSRGLGNWTDTILISLDGTNTGLHNFTLNILNSYDITGSHTVWVTVKEPDVTPPTINSPTDLFFEEGSIGYSITWTGDDEHPWRAVILLNSTPVYNESWTGENITARLDPIDRYPQALTAGVHNFTCVLYDWEGRWTGDSVLVTIGPHVPDVIPPTVTAPAPLEYVEGTDGNYLTWNASDDHPKAYQWFVNETKQGYYPWRGGAFNISIDRFQVGIWNITVTVFDLSGNNATASTVVTVTPIPPDVNPPSVSSPVDLEIYEISSKSIVWEVSDDYPDRYVIYKNSSTLVKQGYWSTGIIQYLLTSLTVNTWELNLTVWDESGNWNSSVVLVTVLPGMESESTAPVIALMSDLSIEFDSSGNIATFRVFDEHPGSIEVFLDSTRISQLPWFDPNQKVMVSLDGLAIGTYNFTLVACDIFGNSASRSITVQVTGDSNPPVLSSPDSLSVSSSENATITWMTSDENLAYYEIFLVHANGTVKQLQTESLTGMTSETIQFTISGFPEGEYTIRLIVYDTAGHRTVDEVFVIVGPSVVQRSPGFEFVTLLAILLLYAISRRAGRKREQDQLRRNNL